MNGHEPFIQEIAAAPDDDAPRLIFADWLEERGDPRGEFIRVQCELAHLERHSEDSQELVIREANLLRDFETQWVGSAAEFCQRWTFRRGFLEYVEIVSDNFIKFSGQLFAKHPVRSASFRVAPNDLSKLAACPYLSRLSGISIGSHWIDYGELESLLDSHHFPRLSKLVMLGSHLTDAEARLIAAAPVLDRLQVLDISRNDIRNDGVAAIAGSRILAELTALLLNTNTIRLLGARALAESAHLQQLRYVDLRNNPIPQRGIDIVRARFGRQACEV